MLIPPLHAIDYRRSPPHFQEIDEYAWIAVGEGHLVIYTRCGMHHFARRQISISRAGGEAGE
jgi:hypothetical protein